MFNDAAHIERAQSIQCTTFLHFHRSIRQVKLHTITLYTFHVFFYTLKKKKKISTKERKKTFMNFDDLCPSRNKKKNSRFKLFYLKMYMLQYAKKLFGFVYNTQKKNYQNHLLMKDF